MDNLAEFFISDEDEPQPKTRKTKKVIPRSKQIKISNFSQVKNINIFDPEYKKWINKFNSKIYNHFKKVHYSISSIFWKRFLSYLFLKVPNENFTEEKVARIVQNQLQDFQKGWDSLVASIDSNTRQIALNSEDLLTINANVQNAEKEILKISAKNQKLEKSSKNYFENVETWTKETFDSITQIQSFIPEVVN